MGALKKILGEKITPDAVIAEVKKSGCAAAAAPASRRA